MKIFVVFLLTGLGGYKENKLKKIVLTKEIFWLTACAQSTSIDDFDKENKIVDLNDDLKAEEQKRLNEVEAEIMEDNEKYAKGEASSGMKLYPWSDESKDEIEAEKMGLSREWDPSRGVMLHQKELWDWSCRQRQSVSTPLKKN